MVFIFFLFINLTLSKIQINLIQIGVAILEVSWVKSVSRTPYTEGKERPKKEASLGVGW